jgi:hypothetical protein
MINFRWCNLLLLGILLFRTTLNSQGSLDLRNSFGKYSYSVMLISDGYGIRGFGTCFFATHNGSLYLITAKHILYKCDSTTNMLAPTAQTAVILIPEPFETISISIPKKQGSCLPISKDPDLSIIRINNEWVNKVNTVNSFFLPPFEIPGDTEIYGQGFKDDTTGVGFDLQKRIAIPMGTYEFFGMPPKDDYVDSTRFMMKMNEIKTGRQLLGFSGSPIFLQDHQSKRWRISGVLIGGQDGTPEWPNGAFVAIRGDYVLRELELQH